MRPASWRGRSSPPRVRLAQDSADPSDRGTAFLQLLARSTRDPGSPAAVQARPGRSGALAPAAGSHLSKIVQRHRSSPRKIFDPAADRLTLLQNCVHGLRRGLGLPAQLAVLPAPPSFPSALSPEQQRQRRNCDTQPATAPGTDSSGRRSAAQASLCSACPRLSPPLACHRAVSAVTAPLSAAAAALPLVFLLALSDLRADPVQRAPIVQRCGPACRPQ